MALSPSAAAKYTKQSEGFPAGLNIDGQTVSKQKSINVPREYVKYVMDWADRKSMIHPFPY